MSVKVHNMQVIIFLFVWYLREIGQILSARVQPKHVCTVFWSPKNMTLGAKLYFQQYIFRLPSSLLHYYVGESHSRGPRTAQQGKWYAVIHLTIDKPEKQRRGKIWSLAEH